MKNLSTVFTLLCLLASVPSKGQTGEARLSLNGFWQFKAFVGDGSNTLNTKPGPGDLLIDNAQTAHVAVSGNWALSTQPQRQSKMWGANYLTRTFYTKADSAYVRFKTAMARPGHYQVFFYAPWGHHNATIVRVKHKEGVYARAFSQRNRPSTWLSVGTFRMDSGCHVDFTSYTKNGVSADVVMLRPVDGAAYQAAQREKARLVALGYDDKAWQTLKVPGHFGMINAYANYTGKAWYRKTFALPQDWKKQPGERIRIRFEGVYHVGRVFLNGQYLGRHQGGFTPFAFDVTEALRYTGDNVVAVEVDNEYTVGATWNWGGIIRDVNLVKNNDARIAYQYIHATPDLAKGTASYEVQIRVENNADVEKTLALSAAIAKDGPLTASSAKITVGPNATKTITLSGELAAGQVKLWHFDRPELYTLETTLMEGGQLLHKRSDRFGIRAFRADGTKMYLNGEPVRLVGFNRVSDHRYWGSSEPEALLRLDVDLMKRAGCTFARIMHGTQNKKLLELCDEKGIMIFEEANIRNLRNPQFQQPGFGYAKKWVKAMIERDANHACIVGWSVGNELDDHWEYVKEAYAYAKRLDPHRMALHVSNHGYYPKENATNTPLNYGDMVFQNIYQKDPGKVMDTIRARWPERAMFISEFGWAPQSRFKNASLDNDFQGLGAWYGHLRGQRPYVNGASIWTYNDYRSGYMLSLPSENRAWGMVNAWRTKRRYWYTHLAENSPAKTLAVRAIDLKKRKAAVAITIRDATDFPSFTMQGYTLRYAIEGQNGRILSKGEKALPTLKPGMGAWAGEIAWGKAKGRPYALHVALATPNGYTRREKRVYFDVPARPAISVVKTANDKARVHFARANDAFEYYARYQIDGEERASRKTIAHYIDLDSLPPGKKVTIRLVARNAKGDSEASAPVVATTAGKALAPIVWDGFIADNRLVVGYSGAWEDQAYTVRYGPTKDRLDRAETSNARGMMTVPINGEQTLYFQVKRATTDGESQWSAVVKAEKGKFRIHE